MLICYSKFLSHIFCRQYNINTVNFLYCSAINDSSGLKKAEVGTCLDVLRSKYLHTAIILGNKLSHCSLNHKEKIQSFYELEKEFSQNVK